MGITGNTTRQTAVITAKPHTAVVRPVGTHHDVTQHGAVLLRIARQLFTGFGVIDDDTLFVGAQPVVAEAVLGHGIDVTHFLQVHHVV